MPEKAETPIDFERRVAALYRAAGASVEHDTEVGGNQVDVRVIERTAAGTNVRLLVECKALSRPTGVDAVNTFATKVALLKSKSLVDVGVLVSRSDFTRDARRAAATHDIHLVTIEDLEQIIQAPTRVVLQDVTSAVDLARRLATSLKEALRGPDRMSHFEMDSLHAEISKSLHEYQLIVDRHRVMPPSNQEVRRALTAVVKLEEVTDHTLDALHYFRRVDEAISASEDGLPPAGRTEADYAAANSIRLRDLEQARAQLRFRLKRLEETCDGLMIN